MLKHLLNVYWCSSSLIAETVFYALQGKSWRWVCTQPCLILPCISVNGVNTAGGNFHFSHGLELSGAVYWMTSFDQSIGVFIEQSKFFTWPKQCIFKKHSN